MAAAKGHLTRKVDLREDEVTSCIFGEMKHLPVQTVWAIFNHLATNAKINKDFFDVTAPEWMEFKFWPKWDTASGHVEPDLVVHFFKDNQPVLHVIVEVKWDAQLSPPCELVRQWRHHLPDDKATWLHLYIVKESAKGWNEIGDSLKYFEENCPQGCESCEDKKKKKGLSNKREFSVSDWQARLGCIGWRHLVNAVRDDSSANPDWVEGVSAFFKKQGIVPFTGFAFTWLNEKDIKYLLSGDNIFFRRDPWFSFLQGKSISCKLSEMIFFKKSK